MFTLHADLPWAAGFYEGEGSIVASVGIDRRSNSRYRQIQVEIRNTDLWCLEKFKIIVGIGNILQVKGGWNNPMYVWKVNGFENSQFVMTLLWEHLSPRRQEQANFALDKYRTRSTDVYSSR